LLDFFQLFGKLIYIWFNKTERSFMKVFTGKQAEDMILKDRYPIDSIGVCKTKYGYAYWFWNGHTFDSGVEETEEQALRTAKANFKS